MMKRKRPLYSVNAALMVSGLGYVAAAGVGLSTVSGMGGQRAMAQAAHESDGRSIIVLPSRRYDKKAKMERSTIVPVLPEGTPTSLAGQDSEIIITEYGMVHGIARMTEPQRYGAMYSLCHPEERDWYKSEVRRKAGVDITPYIDDEAYCHQF
jgi:acyl-CoA hydrolase